MRRRSKGTMVGGIVVTGVGGVFGLTGLMFLGLGNQERCTTSTYSTTSCFGYDYTPAGTAIAIIGMAGLVAGIPMIVYGSERVPVHPGASAALVFGPNRLALVGTF